MYSILVRSFVTVAHRRFYYCQHKVTSHQAHANSAATCPSSCRTATYYGYTGVSQVSHWQTNNVLLYELPLFILLCQVVVLKLQQLVRWYHLCGVSLSKQYMADLMLCHGTQTMHNSRVCHCLVFHECGMQNFMQPSITVVSRYRWWSHMLTYCSHFSGQGS